MTDRMELDVAATDVGRRLDLLLAEKVPSLSRSLIQTLIRNGNVLVNHGSSKPAYRVASGDNISVVLSLPPSLSAAAEKIPLFIVYRDADLAVIDKPAGLVVHPAPGHPSGTLANALVGLFPQLQMSDSTERPGIVHRLDKDTSGLMVVALNPISQKSLQEQIAAREVTRKYLALATGHFEAQKGTIEAPIGRHRSDRRRMAAFGSASRAATTSYRVLELLPGFTLVEAVLHTGRTHQIRVHFQAIGHPLAGDRTYGGGSVAGLGRQFLHAHRLGLRSPSTGERMDFASDPPGDLSTVLTNLRGQEKAQSDCLNDPGLVR